MTIRPIGFTEFIRAVVRPVITITGWVVLVYMVIMGQADKMPNWFYVTVIGNTAWWFGERAQKPKQ